MNRPRPEFHLQRVMSDGCTGHVEVYPVHDLPSDTHTSRRGFLGAGVALASLLTVVDRESRAADQLAATGGRQSGVVYAHLLGVSTLVVTPDSKLLASGSWDKSVKLWSLPEGKLLHTFAGHDVWVRGLVISPNGEILASGDGTGKVRLWSLPDGKPLKTLTGHKGLGTHLVITPDSKLLASSAGGKLKFWSLPDGASLKTITADKIGVGGLALNDDGTILASRSANSVKLWSVPEGKPLKVMPHKELTSVIIISPDGQTLISSHSRGKIRLWSLPAGEIRQELNDQTAGTMALAISPDSTFFASGGDRTIKLWSLPEGQLLRSISDDANATRLAISPDGSLLVSSADKTIKLWSLPAGEPLRTLDGHPAIVDALTITPDGQWLISGDQAGTIIIWSLARSERLTFLFDAPSSSTDALTYRIVEKTTQRTITYTVPCGTPIPADATCVCNCVAGTHKPAPVPKAATPPPVATGSPLGPPPAIRSSGGGFYCTCNKICTCIPVCQAHQLLHPNALVRALAEELLLLMGRNEITYMRWARDRASGTLREQICHMLECIVEGAQPRVSRWPSAADCRPLLDDADEVVAIMGAQMLATREQRLGFPIAVTLRKRVGELLQAARERPWHVRHTA